MEADAGLPLCSVDLPRAAPAGPALLARRLVAWHGAAGLPPCAWVGYSLRGQVCVHGAAARQRPVSRLVRLAPSVPDAYAGYDASRIAADLLADAPASWWQTGRGPGDPARAGRLAAADHGLRDRVIPTARPSPTRIRGR